MRESWMIRHLRRFVPVPVRRRIRIARREVPVRLRDLPADLWGPRLPPPDLRGRVGIDSSRAHFLDVGRRVADELWSAFASIGTLSDHPRWLDFGCGAGRVARFLEERESIRVTGIDIDRDAIRWASRHLRGRYEAVDPNPPTHLPDAAFDVAVAVSVFTHLDEPAQFAWLAELHRLLRPGGLLLGSTMAPRLMQNRPDLTPEDHRRLQERGFVFRAGAGSFNEESAFHSHEYLEREWGRTFDLLAFRPAGLNGHLDLAVWRRREGPAPTR